MPPILVTCDFSALVINRKVTVFFYGRSSGVLHEKALDCNVLGPSRLRPRRMLGQSSGWQGEGSRRSNAGLIQIGKCSADEARAEKFGLLRCALLERISAFEGKANILATGGRRVPFGPVLFLRALGDPPYSDRPIVPWSNSTSRDSQP